MSTKIDPVGLLEQLVAIPSPNPPGDTRAVARHIARFLADAGFRTRLMSPPELPEALSVVADIGGGDRAPTILLHAHIDTVPVAEGQTWTGDPYRARIDGDYLYGLGACDDKGPMAVMMAVAAEWAEQVVRRGGRLLVVGAADEEAAGIYGTGFLRDRGVFDDVDFAIIGEQTNNRAALAHKGTIRCRLSIRGRSVHATNPDRGANAISGLARVVNAVDRCHEGLRNKRHPLAGNPTCSVNVVAGGTSPSVVADKAEAWIDRRTVPGEDQQAALTELKELIGRALGGLRLSWELDPIYFSAAFEETKRTPLLEQFMASIRTVTGNDPGPVGYMPGSDAKFFNGHPRATTVVFGPGSYEQAHSGDEFVGLTELREARAILSHFLASVYGEATARSLGGYVGADEQQAG